MSERPRTPYGKFQRLKPLIHHLYVECSLPRGVIAERLDLPGKTLTARISEWGFATERAQRDELVADQVLAAWEETK